MKPDVHEYLNQIYHDPKHPAAYAGPDKLYKVVNKKGKKPVISKKQIKEWLQGQDSYTLNRDIKLKHSRPSFITQGLDYLWDIDLADVSNLAKYNDGVKFLLICIDTFSRYLWVRPIVNKTNQSVQEAMSSIFSTEDRRPEKMRSDQGLEFVGRNTQKFLKNNGIIHFTTVSDTKACFAERVIRSLKRLMYRYFQANQTYRYLDVLQDLIHNYNNRPHSSLPDNMCPSDINQSNEALVWKRMYVDGQSKGNKSVKYKYKIGDYVRLSHTKKVFQKDYQEKWTPELFEVSHRWREKGIPVYRVRDFMDEPVKGTWYQEDLQKVRKDKDKLWLVENIVKRRTRKGVAEALVKWQGWPDKFNSWEPVSQLIEI